MHDTPGQLRVIKVFIGLSIMIGSQENIWTIEMTTYIEEKVAKAFFFLFFKNCFNTISKFCLCLDC